MQVTQGVGDILEDASLAWALKQSMDEMDNEELSKNNDSFLGALTAVALEVRSPNSTDLPALFDKACSLSSGAGARSFRICVVSTLSGESWIVHSRIHTSSASPCYIMCGSLNNYQASLWLALGFMRRKASARTDH